MNHKQHTAQWFFTTMSHRFYDLLVYRLVSPFIWQCPTDAVLDTYYENVSDKHLEIGVGTAYLLRNTGPYDGIDLTLMDLNQQCLNKSAKQLASLKPALQCHDILRPITEDNVAYGSIGVNYVLHCVPGDFKEKAIAFRHIHRALRTGGVFFGSTLLSQGTHRSTVSKLLMKALNILGIFSNANDTLQDFKHAIESQFELVEFNVMGSAVFWRATKL